MCHTHPAELQDSSELEVLNLEGEVGTAVIFELLRTVLAYPNCSAPDVAPQLLSREAVNVSGAAQSLCPMPCACSAIIAMHKPPLQAVAQQPTCCSM